MSEKSNIPQGNNATLNAFKNEFSSTLTPVYINSLGKEVSFREVTVNEQKTLSKIMIEHENRKDLIYDTQCQLINKLASDDSFNVYDLNEFDRIRILMEIYQKNYFKETVTYKCPECGCENSYQFDFTKYITEMNKFTNEDLTYTTDDNNRTYIFTLNYPGVTTVSNFYKQYVKKYKNTTIKEKDVLDDMGNIEYVNLFIKNIKMIRKDNPDSVLEADLTTMAYTDVEQLISVFPQDIIFSEEKGVLRYVTREFIEKLNNVFKYEKCAQCGAETHEGVGGVGDFF